jgi:threonine synthase
VADRQRLLREGYAHFSHPEIAPVKAVGQLHIQELFHGPTLAFKDLALQPLGGLFGYILERTGGQLNILAATSGDTGSAAIAAVRGRPRLQAVVLHPHGRVSPLQERQMTTVLDANIHNLAVKGSFDDCQSLIKTLFADLPFKDRHHLGAVNSVNLARVLIQVVYYFYGVFRVQDLTGAERVRVTVPTGNFGNVFAGWLARAMGAPIERLVLATNENDILARFFQTGIYAQGEVHQTLSPSMDIQVASNFERYLFYALGADGQRTAAVMAEFARTGRIDLNQPGKPFREEQIIAGRGDRVATLAAIRRYYQQYGYLLDPHTAVGVVVSEALLAQGKVDGKIPTLCLSTAHPAKFSAAIQEALGQDLAHHPTLDALRTLPTRCDLIPNDLATLRATLDRVLA